MSEQVLDSVLENSEEAVPVSENEAEAAQTEQQPEQINLNDMKIAYVVGLAPNGDFVFDVYGQQKGLVELLGVHQHATKKIDRIYEDAQVQGDRLTVEVGRAVSVVAQKLDQVLAVVAPKKPDNQL